MGYDYDVFIVGGGPAGATLARLLKGLKVALIDKKLPNSSGETTFWKPCGGLLSPDAQKSLAKLELSLPSDVLVSPQPQSVKTIDLNSGIVQYYPREYINMNRHKFDMWLLSLVPDSVERISGRCVKIEKNSDSYSVVYRANGEEGRATAKYIVGADGANSLVRRFLMHKSHIKRYTAIQQWFAISEDSPTDYMAAFDSEITDSYAWGLAKDDCFIFGAALPPKNAPRSFEELKEKLKSYGYRFDNLLSTESCQVLTPLTWGDTQPGEDNIFLIGEAGGFISPSSLEGISYALDTAVILADVLNSGATLSLYKKRLRPLRLKLLSKRFKMPFMYNKSLRKLVMKSGVTAVKRSRA